MSAAHQHSALTAGGRRGRRRAWRRRGQGRRARRRRAAVDVHVELACGACQGEGLSPPAAFGGASWCAEGRCYVLCACRIAGVTRCPLNPQRLVANAWLHEESSRCNDQTKQASRSAATCSMPCSTGLTHVVIARGAASDQPALNRIRPSWKVCIKIGAAHV